MSPALPPCLSLPHRVYARTPAKLNLFLELLGKRPDGYHEIETIMTAVNCFDTLCVQRTNAHAGVQIATHWWPAAQYWQDTLGEAAVPLLSIPDDQTNLIHRAITGLQSAFAVASGFDVVVRKRIPAGAGMGGASSDAAAALLAAAALVGISLGSPQLRSLASAIGSDVPFFMGPEDTQASASNGDSNFFVHPGFTRPWAGPQLGLATGRGEQIHPAVLGRRMWFVVAFPRGGLSTAAVYQACEIPTTPVSGLQCLAALTSADHSALHFTQVNRLSHPAQSLSPLVGELLGLMNQCCGSHAMMTGSGSACFRICPDRQSAFVGAEELRKRWSATGASGHVMVAASVAASPRLKACW